MSPDDCICAQHVCLLGYETEHIILTASILNNIPGFTVVGAIVVDVVLGAVVVYFLFFIFCFVPFLWVLYFLKLGTCRMPLAREGLWTACMRGALKPTA